MEKYCFVILAAGKGTRMKSNKIKILHKILGKTVIEYVLATTDKFEHSRKLLIIGHQKDIVKKAINRNDVDYIIQEKQLGTGHAVLQTLPHLSDDEKVILLSGDVPLLTSQTIQKLLDANQKCKSPVTVLTAIFDEPFGYGRVVSNGNYVEEIVEEKDATDLQKKIKEINSGIYVFDAKFLKDTIPELSSNNSQGEFYLTDVVKIANSKGLKVGKLIVENPNEIEGINSREQLANMEKVQSDAIKQKLMKSGVTLKCPENIWINTQDIEIGKDTIVHPFTSFEGKIKIGENCLIKPYTYLKDIKIGDNKIIHKNE